VPGSLSRCTEMSVKCVRIFGSVLALKERGLWWYSGVQYTEAKTKLFFKIRCLRCTAVYDGQCLILTSNLGVRGSNPFERARFQGFFERAKFLALRK
jgi:hypothetical protein